MRAPSVAEADTLIARTVRRHALGWLVAANAVGVWLAAVLVWPALGDLAAPLTYGRWMPVHLNWQLYGWCALPLVGVLMKWILRPEHPAAVRHARVALGAWSAALGLGAISWIGGTVSGKIFLDWQGWARPVLPLAMIGLLPVLAAHAWWVRRQDRGAVGLAKAAVLTGLLAVPALRWWAADRAVYPPINVDSGGATGASLLGSTLGIVELYGLMPRLLGVRGKEGAPSGRAVAVFWGSLAVSLGVWGAIERGNSSYHDGGQILGLGLLMAWVPLLAWWWRQWAWSPGARRWMGAALIWWAVLVGTGWLTFCRNYRNDSSLPTVWWRTRIWRWRDW